jgi:hypothetical protein
LQDRPKVDPRDFRNWGSSATFDLQSILKNIILLRKRKKNKKKRKDMS